MNATATAEGRPSQGKGDSSPERPAGAESWASMARVGLLAISDLLALLLAGLGAFLLWASRVHGQPAILYIPAAPGALLIVLAYAQARLYPGFGLGSVEVLRRYWLITAAAFLGLSALVFLLKLDNTYSRMTMALALGLSLVLVPALRRLTLRIARRWSWWPEPVLLVGRGERTRRLLDEWPEGEIRPVATLSIEAADPAPAAPAGGNDPDPLPAGHRDALEEARRYADAGVRIAFADVEDSGGSEIVDRLRLLFPRVIILRRVQDLPVEGVQVRNLGGVLGLEYGNNLLRRQSRWVKRSLDLGIATLALVPAVPLMLLATMAVKLLSHGPALFLHPREGRRGRTIQVPKIRTMMVDAEREMERLLQENPELREQWEAGYKLRDDPRVIPWVGRLLRRFSIDELPQLFSVLKGDMSLVGPRPFPPYHLEALSPHARHLRAEVRPGITGLWQVVARGEADVEAQQAYDLYYIRNWSLWLDLYILALTVSAVLSGRGAH